MLNLDKIDLKDDTLIIQNEDNSITCIPREGATGTELSLFEEFESAFPEGKPQPIIEPIPPEPSQEDYLVDMDYRLSLIELGVK